MLHASVQLYRNAYSGIPTRVWWLSLVVFINRCGTMVIPLMTVFLTEQGYTLSEAGLVMAAFGLGSVLGGYLGGRLTDQFGAHYVQVVSLLLNGLLFLLLGQMQTLWQYAACIFVLSSLGEAFRPANATAIANCTTDDNRIRSYALNRLAVNLGWGIGPAVGGLLAEHSNALLFWADGLTCIAASLLLLFLLQPDVARPKETAKEKIRLSSAYHDKIFMQGMFYLFLITLAFFQLFNVVPAYFRTEVSLSKTVIGALLAMNGLIIALFEMIIVYKLENRRSSIVYIAIGALLIGLSFLFFEVGRTLPVVVTAMVIVTVGEMFLFPFLNNFWVKRSSASNRGEYAAVYTMAFASASVLAPTLGTQLAAHGGFTLLWIVDFLLCSLAALGFYFLKKEL